MASKRISYKVEGVVQGVNFRSFAAGQGKSLGLTGFVQNDPEGTVSGEAQGDESKLNDFAKALKEKAQSPARVDNVETKDIEGKEGETGFDKVKSYESRR